MSFSCILYDVVDGVARLTFNRPEVANGFNVPMCEEILTAINTASVDDEVRILLIRANGKIFSVGGDLSEMQRAVDSDNVQSLVKIAELVKDISFSLKRLSKPVVMSVDGPVAGAAANMVLAADFCVASNRARFIQAFVNVGLAPDAGGLYLLTRAIGVTRATQLVMTGESITADKALDYGMIYQVCESEKLERTTNRLLVKLKRGASRSYKAIKEMVWKSLFASWQDYVELELRLQESLAFTEDFKEGVRAYSEKRRPKFTGK